MKATTLSKALTILLGLCAASASAWAQATISLSQVDLYTSSFVVNGSLDIDNPPAASASGSENWMGSASSNGTGSSSSSGNYTSQVGSGAFEISGTASASITSASAGGNGVAAASLRIDFTVPVLSEGFLYTTATLFSSDSQTDANALTRLTLEEDSVEIILLELFATGSLNQTVSLSPGKSYTMWASLESAIGNSVGSKSASASSGGTGMTVTAVPEPGTCLLVGLGLATLLARRRRRN